MYVVCLSGFTGTHLRRRGVCGRVTNSVGEAILKNTKIINLGMIRDLLPEWLNVKERITTEKVSGFYTVILDDQGRETIHLGGVYKQDSLRALKAGLKLSAARTLTEDSLPHVANSNF